MHGIYIQFVLLMFNMLTVEGYALSPGSPNNVESNFPSLESHKNGAKNDLIIKDLYPKKVQKLLSFLRKHQHDEAELKYQIKTLLANFQAVQLGEPDVELSKEKMCLCKTKTVRAILTMLNLSSKQTELLEKIVVLMKGPPRDSTSTKREKIEPNEDLDVGFPAYYGLGVGERKHNTMLLPSKENKDTGRYGSDLALTMGEIKDIAKEVIQIINSHTDQTEQPVGRSLAEKDVSPVVSSSEPSALEQILF